MKNKVLFVLLFAMIAVSVSGCTLTDDTNSSEILHVQLDSDSVPDISEDETGDEADDVSETESDTVTEQETEVTESEVPSESETETVDEAEEIIPDNEDNSRNVRYAGISSDTDIQTAAAELIRTLQKIEIIGCGGGVRYDENSKSEVPYNDFTVDYAKVTDDRFGSYDEAVQYLRSVLSDNMLSGRYGTLLGGELPMFDEFDGDLYVNIGGGRGGFSWLTDENGEPLADAEKTSDTSYDVAVKVEAGGGEYDMVLRIIAEDGIWKIDGMSDPFSN